MSKVSWKIWKTSFPFKCSICDHAHNTKREYCESCGAFNVLIKTNKKDYNNYNKNR